MYKDTDSLIFIYKFPIFAELSDIIYRIEIF